jgi:hypothetical protein
MRNSVVVFAFLFPAVCVPGFAQQGRGELATSAVASFTRPSPGEFVSGWNAGTRITQASRAGVGQSLEYRYFLRGNSSAGLLYSRTPTDSKLIVPGSPLNIWPLSRNEFDLLFTRRLRPLAHGILLPYGAAGGGAIVLNGGASESGLDRQAAFVAAGGGDIRVSRQLRLRIGLTADILKASTYSDPTYRSSWTVMAQPKVGFVLPWGAAAR